MGRPLLKRIQPARARTKVLEWPFPVEGEAPKVRLRVLPDCDMEQAALAVQDHFKEEKRKIEFRDPLFQSRMRVELVWRAYRDLDGEPIAETADQLAQEPPEVITVLHREWDLFHQEVNVQPLNTEQMDELIELVKKNSQPDLLHGLPSTWLSGLVVTLVSRLENSTQANSLG